jgi:hypothetical protein
VSGERGRGPRLDRTPLQQGGALLLGDRHRSVERLPRLRGTRWRDVDQAHGPQAVQL